MKAIFLSLGFVILSTAPIAKADDKPPAAVSGHPVSRTSANLAPYDRIEPVTKPVAFDEMDRALETEALRETFAEYVKIIYTKDKKCLRGLFKKLSAECRAEWEGDQQFMALKKTLTAAWKARGCEEQDVGFIWSCPGKTWVKRTPKVAPLPGDAVDAGSPAAPAQ